MKLNTLFAKTLILVFAFVSFSCEYESLDNIIAEDVASGAIHAGTYKLTRKSASSPFNINGDNITSADLLSQNICLQGSTIILSRDFTFVENTSEIIYLPNPDGDNFISTCSDPITLSGTWAFTGGNTVVLTVNSGVGQSEIRSYTLSRNKLRKVEPMFPFFTLNTQGEINVAISQVTFEYSKL